MGGAGGFARGQLFLRNLTVTVAVKHVRSIGKISCAAACFYLHMWVPTHLWEIELTNMTTVHNTVGPNQALSWVC